MLIAIVGVDGTGKSTQAALLETELAARGMDVVRVWSRWEPRNLARLGGLVRWRGGRAKDRAVVDDAIVSRKRYLMRSPALRYVWLRTASFQYRRQVRVRVERELQRGRTVVADRYLADFIVDQESNLGYEPAERSRLFRLRVMHTFPVPDLTIVLDTDPREAVARKQDGTSPEELIRKREHYRALGRGTGAVLIDASDEVESVHGRIVTAVNAILPRG